jgi:peptide/nickel transport system substrate-binding protein
MVANGGSDCYTRLHPGITRRQTLAFGGALALQMMLESAVRAAEAIHRGGTLRIGLDLDPPTLDPHRSGYAVDRQVFQNLYDKLVDTDQTLKIVPMLATSWSISADGKIATFKLRRGVRFHDGTPFNAQAAVYNFHRMLFDPSFPSVRRSELRPVKKVVATDAYTIQLIMDQPYSPLLYVLTDRAGMMVSPAAAQKEGLNFALHPVGTGPFVFSQRVVGDHITLKRNPNYWDQGLPYLDTLIYRPFTDDAARVANLEAGELDIINVVPLPQIKTLRQEAAKSGARFRLIELGPIAWTSISLNVTAPPFNNKLLRQAFERTVDRRILADDVLQGAAYPAYSFFPNGTPAYDASWKLPPPSVAAAKKLLKAGGHPNGFAFTMLTQPGQQRQAIAQAVQSMTAEAGIQMKIEVLEAGTYNARITKVRDDAAFIEWSGRPDPDFDIYPFVTKSGLGAFNYAGYVNADVQALLDKAREAYDMSRRRPLYAHVTRILANDVPYVWLYYPKEYKLVATTVRGFIDQPDGMMRFRTAWLAS